MNKPNSKMIELARNVRGITQKDLIKLLPTLTQSTLSKIESSGFNITQDTISRIAEALDFPIEFFYQDEVRTPISNIYFRKRASLSQKILNKIIGDVKIVLKSVDYLLEEIEISEYPKFKFDISEGWTPESVAIRMREIMKIPAGPIADPVKYIEQLGIVVYFYDCPDLRFDGLTAYSDNGVPVTFVNKNLPNDRIKFTLAHELLHLVCHIPCDIEPWRDFEAEANSFPGEFYMPTKECSRDLKGLSYNQLASLKAFWGISKAAIIYKAKATNCINEATYRYLMIELGRKNERKTESGFVDIDAPTTLDQVIRLLKTELDYSDQDIADKLRLNLPDYVRLFDPSSGESKVKIRRLKPAI